MKSISKTIIASAAALCTFAVVGAATPAAYAGEFCSTNTSGMRGCGYTTMEQCQASTAGVGGSCFRDPYYSNAARPAAPWPTNQAPPPQRESVIRQSGQPSIEPSPASCASADFDSAFTSNSAPGTLNPRFFAETITSGNLPIRYSPTPFV